MVDNQSETTVSLAAKGVTLQIGNRKIINKITANIELGRVTVLIGPNGAGKSTLLAGFAGHLSGYSGSVFLGDTELVNIPPRRLSELRAVMLQSDNIVFDFTVDDVIRMGFPITPDLSLEDQATIVNDLSRKCGVQHMLNQSILTLSGGEKQRVHFCRCLVQLWSAKPQVFDKYLLLDEPTSGQDIANELLILRFIKDLSKRGMGILLVLHDLNLAARFGDFFLLLKNGVILAEGDRDAIMNGELLSNVYETPVTTEKHNGNIRIHTF